MSADLGRVLAAVDRVYAVEDAGAWLGRVVGELRSATAIDSYMAMLFGTQSGGPDSPVPVPVAVELGGDVAQRLFAMTSEMCVSEPGAFDDFKAALTRCFEGRPAFRQKDVAADAFFARSPLGRALNAEGVRDQVILATTDGGLPGLLAIGLELRPPIEDGPALPALTALAPHVSAAARLVKATIGGSPRAVEARLSPAGRILDAAPVAAPSRPRASLAAAVHGIERARGPLSRRDPEAALALRVALVAGRWSLVEHWETGMHRYWAAVENRPGPAIGPDRLTDRQRQILHLLGRDMSDGEIAQELGIREGTVATHVRDACRRLGVRGRRGLLGALAHPARFLATPKETG
ncbi:MAG: helix-turn-helix transcriptional regulator [Deltaproteobacteria bacterium]|nr:helix-turn-helix transcriptional regulator [Deltaproteobacteria bacterium]